MEYLKGFDFRLLYHLNQANVVTDVLSRKERKSPHQQVSRLWARSRNLIAINLILYITR